MRSSQFLRSPIPRSSYYDKHYYQSPALIRARQPYLIKNIVAGAGLCCFVIAVYAYTIKAVSQDEFADVVVPEQPRAPAAAPHAGPGKVLGSQGVERS